MPTRSRGKEAGKANTPLGHGKHRGAYDGWDRGRYISGEDYVVRKGATRGGGGGGENVGQV